MPHTPIPAAVAPKGGDRFAAPFAAVVAPPASPYLTKARLALTCAQALPMVCAVRFLVRPAQGLSDDAPESVQNLPRQKDVMVRQNALTLTPEAIDLAPVLCRQLTAASNLQWLASGFQLILGAGFFGMYQHAGVMRALTIVGLHQHISALCGLSSGAITAALYATLGPEEMTDCLLKLSLLDVLDLSPVQFFRAGALCAGKAVARKIAQEAGRYGCVRLEDVPGPKLSIAVFDGVAGRTVWHTQGPLAQTVARSAALPVLFANDGHLDGGWVDHHGYTALRPGQRALSVRINTGVAPDAMHKLVQRPTALFNISEDSEHKTLALRPHHTISGSTFFFDIDFRKEKLAGIIQESQDMFTWWLHQPEASPMRAAPQRHVS